MNDKIEQMIDEIHDMLIEYMNESAAAPILKKVSQLAEDAHRVHTTFNKDDEMCPEYGVCAHGIVGDVFEDETEIAEEDGFKNLEDEDFDDDTFADFYDGA